MSLTMTISLIVKVASVDSGTDIFRLYCEPWSKHRSCRRVIRLPEDEGNTITCVKSFYTCEQLLHFFSLIARV